MKIKEVCEQTGLTDRAVRYYIEEELITPFYKENYLGRRAFDFSQADADRLGQIAVLRKFGFTIAEIREIFARPDAIGNVLRAVRERKEKNLSEQQTLLCALTRAQEEQPDSISALVSYLSEPVETLPLPASDGNSFGVLRVLRSVGLFLATWLPPILCVLALIVVLRFYYYPVYNGFVIALTALSLLPSLLMLLLPRLPLKERAKRKTRIVILVFCVLSIVISPILTFGIVSRSETTDIRNYRKLDPDCLANRIDLYQELFPAWPHYFENVRTENGFETVYLDAHYLYRDLPAFDYTYDIYAEWPLEEDAFYAEIERVRDVFSAYPYETVEKGAYTCMILSDGEPLFEPVTDSYTYCIFAYNEAEKRVRYLFCDSLENGEDQPYYLELDWD